MKKLLIIILVILFCCVWIVFGLRSAIAYLIAIPMATILILGIFKWVEFVDKHIKD